MQFFTSQMHKFNTEDAGLFSEQINNLWQFLEFDKSRGFNREGAYKNFGSEGKGLLHRGA